MTPEQLKRFALEHGAMVEHGGKVFNSGFSKSGAKAVSAPKPEPAAAPPAKSNDGQLIASAIKLMVDHSDRQALLIAEVLQQKPPSSPPKQHCSWKFTMKRDNNDLLTEIIATPIMKD